MFGGIVFHNARGFRDLGLRLMLGITHIYVVHQSSCVMDARAVCRV